jgi:hypothetical protein
LPTRSAFGNLIPAGALGRYSLRLGVFYLFAAALAWHLGFVPAIFSFLITACPTAAAWLSGRREERLHT